MLVGIDFGGCYYKISGSNCGTEDYLKNINIIEDIFDSKKSKYYIFAFYRVFVEFGKKRNFLKSTSVYYYY